MPEKFSIEIGDGQSVTALLYPAGEGDSGATLLLGHGAGASQTSDFMVTFAKGLSARGMNVLTFNFLYMEQGRKYPDNTKKLEECYGAAIRAVRERAGARRLLVGGKSLGGRISSQVVASGSQNAGEVVGLVFLGYPLHPPGQPEKQRSKHLFEIQAPMLFCQGSRDAFGTPEEIQQVLKDLRVESKIYAIEGDDHSFKVPKRSPFSQDEVFNSVMDEVAAWVAAL